MTKLEGMTVVSLCLNWTTNGLLTARLGCECFFSRTNPFSNMILRLGGSILLWRSEVFVFLQPCFQTVSVQIPVSKSKTTIRLGSFMRTRTTARKQRNNKSSYYGAKYGNVFFVWFYKFLSIKISRIQKNYIIIFSSVGSYYQCFFMIRPSYAAENDHVIFLNKSWNPNKNLFSAPMRKVWLTDHKTGFYQVLWPVLWPILPMTSWCFFQRFLW